jgi:acyl-CoA synthetase (AMP-forming)/AMP-acid ligase II
MSPAGRAATLQRALFGRLAKDPSRRALAFADAQGDYTWQTGEEVMADAAGRAAGLAALGLRKGDVCLNVLPSSAFCASILLGTLHARALPLLVAPPTLQGLSADLLLILKGVITRVQPRLAVLPETMADWRGELARVRPGTRIVIGEAEVPPGPPAGPDLSPPGPKDLVALQLTSGTTGVPRVVMWRHANVLASLTAMVRAMRLGREDVCFNWTPLYHDMGLVNNFFLSLTAGVPLALLSPTEFVKRPVLWFRGMQQTGATVSWSPNFGYALATQRIRDGEMAGVTLAGVRSLWNAAERIHLETIEAFERRFTPFGLRPAAVRTNFGCAENVGGATFSGVAGRFRAEYVHAPTLYEERVARPVAPGAPDGVWVVSAGRPAPGITIHIVGRTGRALPEGRVGEVALDTPSRMVGYLGDAAATRRALRGGRLRTGDLGYLRGGELYWTGRVKERITIHGKKFDPSDFERLLLAADDLRTGCFAVFGVDDGRRGTQRLVIVSEVKLPLRRPAEAIEQDLRQQVSLHLGVSVDEIRLVPPATLGKTSSGKRRHRHVRRQYERGELPALPDGGA